MPAIRRDQETLLNRVVELESQTTRRAEISTAAAIPLRRIATKYELSSLQTELVEGLLIHQLYNTLGPFDIPLCVRDLAQMIAPETYPKNCKKIIEAVTELVEKDIVELNERNGEPCKLSSLARLQSNILMDLCEYLSNDIIDSSDVKAAKRQLYESAVWPL